jgi:hypothetical protein
VLTAVEGSVDLPVIVAILFEDVLQEQQLGLQAVFIPKSSGSVYQSRLHRLFIGWVVMGHLLLASTLSAVDWNLIDRIANEKVLHLADDVRARHCRKFMQLHKTQHPTGPPDTSRTVINLSGVPLEEAACSALSKGLNYAVAPGRIPAKDFLCGVKKATGTLPEETAEEIRQETVRILKGSRQPKDNLTGAERRAFRCLKANDLLTVLPADKGNAAVVLGTLDYNKNIATLLQDKAYAKLKKDPTESI